MNSTNDLKWYEKSGINNFPFLSYFIRESLEEVNKLFSIEHKQQFGVQFQEITLFTHCSGG